MAKWKVKLTETITTTVVVEASDEDEAEEIAGECGAEPNYDAADHVDIEQTFMVEKLHAVRAMACCADPCLRGGRCVTCGKWLSDQ